MFGKRTDETRTSQDRARAAAERAARRAGKPLPPEAFQDTVPPPDAAQFTRPEPPPPPPPPPEPLTEHTVEYTPAFDEPPDAEPTVRRIPREPTEEHAVAVTDPPPLERPAAVKRPPSPPGPRRSRVGFWGRRVFGVIALLIILAALYVINATFQPFHGAGSGTVAVVIPDGADAGDIGKLLEAKGVVDSGTFFQLNATVTGRRGKLHAGHFTLEKGMANGDAIDALTRGPKAQKEAATFKLTLPEGPSRRELVSTVKKSGVEGDYLKASASDSTIKRIRGLGAPKGTKTAEGYLFPATYTLTEGATANELVKEQLAAFEENFKHVDMSYAKKKNLSRYDVLIIASMIEREVQVPKERALVSAVIYNRLKQGMTLGIDATIRYYLNNWTGRLKQSELDKDEPYNTRLNRGLPPTPIGNPGLASLQAAAHPARSKYLFYVAKPG
ncbi:MAG TPA: endolytic transglycosylase MltG, partial [Thermoanaerobaculia bacterium]|nr:endolytic transglycosylase MltG [Thermoanaerobaculia bacterium]